MHVIVTVGRHRRPAGRPAEHRVTRGGHDDRGAARQRRARDRRAGGDLGGACRPSGSTSSTGSAVSCASDAPIQYVVARPRCRCSCSSRSRTSSSTSTRGASCARRSTKARGPGAADRRVGGRLRAARPRRPRRDLLGGRRRAVGAGVVPRGRRRDAGAGPGRRSRRGSPASRLVVHASSGSVVQGARRRDDAVGSRVGVRGHRARARDRPAGAPGRAARAHAARAGRNAR